MEIKEVEKNWNPYKSKWYAAMKKGMDVILKKNDNILYLGASAGYTISRISKLTKGIIFGVENSVNMAIHLIRLAEQRKNIAPIFYSAREVEKIKKALFGKKINILFQDIPSVDQIDILKKASLLVDRNAKIFFSLKTQSISQEKPEKIFKNACKELKKNFKILESKSLEPYQKKHYFFILKKK